MSVYRNFGASVFNIRSEMCVAEDIFVKSRPTVGHAKFLKDLQVALRVTQKSL